MKYFQGFKVKKNTQETKLEKRKKKFLITNQVYILLNGHWKLRCKYS